jgi:hypothetical protein
MSLNEGSRIMPAGIPIPRRDLDVVENMFELATPSVTGERSIVTVVT